MRRVAVRCMLTASVLTVSLAAPVSSAGAVPPPDTFGHHVSQCAWAGVLDGSHNPGQHRGAAGHHHHAC